MGPLHGGTSGTLKEFTLKPGETIVKVDIKSGNIIDGITFYTSTGARYSYGGPGGSVTTVTPPAGGFLAGIKGWAGGSNGFYGLNSIEKLTLIWGRYEWAINYLDL